jgi:outer membrane protein assembly factor BamB/orotate phosphoribosyltransferase
MGENKVELFDIIKKEVIVTSDKEKVVTKKGFLAGYAFDFRRVFLNSTFLNLIAEIFWDEFEEEYPFYVGGQETAAIPLITAIMLKGVERGKPIESFVIRKERKEYDLQKVIEGTIRRDKKIILVDDLINSGSTIVRQVLLLKKAGFDVDKVFVLVRFGRMKISKELEFLEKKGGVKNLFYLDEFGVKPNSLKEVLTNNYKIRWFFKGSKEPSFHLGTTKSIPAFDNDRVYVGSDEAMFYALEKKSGKVAWQFQVGSPILGKSISSSPLIFLENIYFGSYDGNFYALEKKSGKVVWKFQEADYIHSSACVSKKDGLIFVGLERNWRDKKGAIVALDHQTGEKRWEHSMKEYMPSSPAYSAKKGCVAIGCNDGCAYLFEAATGVLKWKFQTEGAVKGSFSFDEVRGLIAFGSYDGNVYIVDIESGEQVKSLKTEDKIQSTPLFYEKYLFASSTDKFIYAYDTADFDLLWKKRFPSRIFSSPKIIRGRLFFGCNDGFIYGLEMKSGKIVSRFDLVEKATNDVVYDKKDDLFFVSNYANEMYCLKEVPNLTESSLELIKKAWKSFKAS